MVDAPPRLVVTADEAASMLSVHSSTIWRWIAEGKLPSHKIGSCRRIRIADLEAFIDADASGASSESEPGA